MWRPRPPARRCSAGAPGQAGRGLLALVGVGLCRGTLAREHVLPLVVAPASVTFLCCLHGFLLLRIGAVTLPPPASPQSWRVGCPNDSAHLDLAQKPAQVPAGRS